MPVTTDIVATYRAPGRVISRLLAAGQREDRALVILVAACAVMFVAQWPRLSRISYLTGEDLQMLLAGSLFSLLFIMPLVLYFVAWLSHAVVWIFGGRTTGYSARLALLAASPLVLFWGLVAGFIGQGGQLTAVGLLWLVIFLWFWIAGLRQAGWKEKKE